MAQKSLAIFYIDANKGYLYGSNLASVVTMDIPQDTMQYMDIINRDKFFQLVQSLITNNKVLPSSLLIVFSASGSYEKEVIGKTQEEINTDIEQFVDSIPYERVLSRIYQVQSKTYVAAVSKDLYEAVKHGFQKMQFSTIGILSYPFLQKIMPEFGTNLNLAQLAGKYETVKQYSLIATEEINNPGKAGQENAGETKSNPFRLYGLVGVFVVLLGILGFMLFQALQPTPRPFVVQRRNPVAVIPTPTLTPFPTIGTHIGTSSGQKAEGNPSPTQSAK